jgi:hypothetical protein
MFTSTGTEANQSFISSWLSVVKEALHLTPQVRKIHRERFAMITQFRPPFDAGRERRFSI